MSLKAFDECPGCKHSIFTGAPHGYGVTYHKCTDEESIKKIQEEVAANALRKSRPKCEYYER